MNEQTFFGFKLKTVEKRPDLTNARKCFGRDGNTVLAAYQLEDGTVYLAGVFEVIDGDGE